MNTIVIIIVIVIPVVFEKITYKVVETFATGDSHELSLLRQSIDGSSSSTDFICISPDDEVILKVSDTLNTTSYKYTGYG